MIYTNIVRLEALAQLGVNPNISKLLMSRYEEDFLLGWELVTDHPNCKWIRIYCKGQTSDIAGLNYDFEKEGRPYYNTDQHRYEFEGLVFPQ